MTLLECPREPEVVDAVASGRWPGRAALELTTHVAGCEVCRDVALVAAAIDAEHAASWASVRVPSSAHVWWRAQMRARREAARQAARPITVVQGVAAASAAGVAAAGLGVAASSGWWPTRDWFSWGGPAWRTWLGDAALSLADAAAALPHAELVAAAGALLLLMPAALYFVLAEE